MREETGSERKTDDDRTWNAKRSAVRGFTLLAGVLLVGITLLLWRTQNIADTNTLTAGTETVARFYASEAEIRFSHVRSLLNALALAGPPGISIEEAVWDQQAAFCIEAFTGIESVSWVDLDLVLRRIEPKPEDQSQVGQKVETPDADSLNLWIPIRVEDKVEGFLVSRIAIATLLLPTFQDGQENYDVRLDRDGITLYDSDIGDESGVPYLSARTVVLQDAGVLSLSVTPTDKLIAYETWPATRTFLLGILVSFVILLTLLYAQKYVSKSRQLEQARNALMKHQLELENANKELEGYSYAISHDLRAPLRHISGFVDLLSAHRPETRDETSHHYLAVIGSEADRMGHMIDDLLSIARMGKVEMLSERLDLGTLVRDVAASFSLDTAGRSVDWRIGILPDVVGDRRMIHIVFTNLFSNALKFSRTRTVSIVEVGASFEGAPEGFVFLTVRDNGVGFDLRFKDRLFLPFQRLHRQEDFEGTGVGLTSVQRVIDRHGGILRADSVLNEGATFSFTLPLFKEGL